MPRSPWLASAGWTKSAGVPVEASVAAILRATWPLLPMPVTTTRPADPRPAGRPRRAKRRSIASARLPQRLGFGQDDPAAAGDRRVAARPAGPGAVAGWLMREASGHRSLRRAVRADRARPATAGGSIRSGPAIVNAAGAHGAHGRCRGSMREHVLVRPAGEVEGGARRQEVEAGLGQGGAALARQHRVEPGAQRVQVETSRAA